MPDWTERYRFDGTSPCIDIRLKSIAQLFDDRDPAPLLERDLDDDAVAYMIDAAEEIPVAAGPLKVALWLTTPPPEEVSADALRDAFARHFEVAVLRIRRRIKRQRKEARAFTLLGLIVLGVLLLLAQLSHDLRTTTIGHLVPEGLTILAWVVMWRPLESLLYDWWPLAKERTSLARVGRAAVEVNVGATIPTAARSFSPEGNHSGQTS